MACLEELFHAFAERDVALDAESACPHHVPQNALPLASRIFVQVSDGDRRMIGELR
jgi:hypothetical protein